MPQAQVLVCGLGRIGALADIGRSIEAPPLSHLGAILKVSDLVLSGVIEPSSTNLSAASERWEQVGRARRFSDIASVPALGWDVVVLSGPSDVRVEHYRHACRLRPRLIVLEKPIAATQTDAVLLRQVAAEAGIETWVNYHRRFDPRHITARDLISGQKPLAVNVQYSKGLRHFASHAIDLLTAWYGPVAAILAGASTREDAIAGDELVNFAATFEAGFTAQFQAVPARIYPVFEIVIHLSERRLTLLQGGARMVLEERDDGVLYSGYPLLWPSEDFPVVDGAVEGFEQLYQNVAKYLNGHSLDTVPCRLPDAMHGLDVVEAVERSVETGGEVMIPHGH